MISSIERNMHALRVKQPQGRQAETISDFIACIGPVQHADRQMLHMLTLTDDERLIDAHLVAIGSVSEVGVHPREVLRYALYDSASQIVLIVNHPSGTPTPSPEEIKAAETIDEAARIMGIHLAEYLIVSRGGNHRLSAHLRNNDLPF